MRCNYCQQLFTELPSLKLLFSFQSISEHSLCPVCLSRFHYLPKKNVCYGCHRVTNRRYCSDCLTWKSLYPQYNFHHEALFVYNKAMQEWFKAYKFSGDYRLRFCFSTILKHHFKTKKRKMIIPLPVSKQRKKIRGFNQVEGLLSAANIDYHAYLARISEDKPQSKKKKDERMNQPQPFIVIEKKREILRGKEVVLVDDIYTTGRTLFHAAEVILECKPAKLETFTLAR